MVILFLAILALVNSQDFLSQELVYDIKAADFGQHVKGVYLEIYNPKIETTTADFVADLSIFERNPLDVSQFVKIDKTDKKFSIEDGQGNVLYKANKYHFKQYQVELDSTIYTSNKQENFTKIFGLGERSGEFFFDDGVYTLWSRDDTNPIEDGEFPGENVYGFHPLYMVRLNSRDFMLVFNNNPYAKDYIIKNDPESGTIQVTEKSIGGRISLFFLFQQVPNLIVQKFHNLIGHALLPPFWALGWHNCKYGYKSLSEIQDVYDNYKKFDFPIDTMWSDIDYMDNYNDFTYSNVTYNGLPSFIQKLHQENRHYVPIIDAGISRKPNQNYPAYDDGVKEGVFMMDPTNSEPFVGKVWPGEAVFPDWFNDKTEAWWQKQLKEFQQIIDFDGLWLDMNEASNFCNGTCWDNQTSKDPVVDKIPYIPGMRSLEWHSVTYDAVHKDGTTEYDRHSLFGFMETKATNGYFKSIDKRPFIITRSTYTGIGKYGSHWLGDNWSYQNYLKHSMQGVFNFNIFGIPLVGADICGFLGNTTKELCTRWQTLGSFYPFSRNHNGLDSISQEPYRWDQIIPGKKITYTDVMRKSIRVKYGLLKYYYTQLFHSHKYGGAFIRPLFFDFPEDPKAYGNVKDKEYIEQNIMIGPALKFSPSFALNETQKEKFYFPAGRWAHTYSGHIIEGPVVLEEATPFEKIRLHMREGYIIPWQFPFYVTTTQELFNIPVSLSVFLNKNQEAKGSLILDDGLTTQADKYNEYSFYFNAQEKERILKVNVEHMHPEKPMINDEKVGRIRILDAQQFSDVQTVVARLVNEKTVDLNFMFNSTSSMFYAWPEKSQNLFWHSIQDILFI